MKIDLEPIEAPADVDQDDEPIVTPYPQWVRLLIWGACIAFSIAFWWGLFLLVRALLR